MNFYKSRSDRGGTIYPAPKHQSSTKRTYTKEGENQLEEKPETYNGQIRAAIFGNS